MSRGLLLLGVLVGLLAAATPSSASFPAAAQRIVLISESFDGAGMTFMNADGTHVRPLGLNVGVHGAASFSADGTHFAVTTTVPLDPTSNASASDIAVGSLLDGFQTVTNDAADDGRATWSPGGKQIAFASNRNGNWDVYVMTLGGTTATDVTAGSPATDRNPRWSPDGRTILFESDRTGNFDIYSMKPDGSGVANLTNDPGTDTLGDWAPDSSRIVFSSTRAGDADLYVMPAMGGTPTRITHDPGADTHAAWSPDGKLIAYTNDGDGDGEVFTIAPDGSGKRRLTTNTSEDIVQDWQPVSDVVAPVPHALRSTGKRGKAAVLRFRLDENSGAALVQIEFSFATAFGQGFGFAVLPISRVVSGRVYRVPIFFRGTKLPRAFRFCVSAVDPSFNESKQSCARFAFVKPKKKS